MAAFGAFRKDADYAFEWPTMYQVEKWNLDRKIQLKRIASNWSSLRNIQLFFTSDIESDSLDCGVRSEMDIRKEIMLNVEAPPGQKRSVPITEISVKMTNDKSIYGLRLKYATGDIHTLYEVESGDWKTKAIPEGKEIIGLYGDYSEDEEKINTLGFILWQPNPFAL